MPLHQFQFFCGTVGTAAVATIFLIYNVYRDHLLVLQSRERLLRERVTYMLWCMAEQVEQD